MKLSEFRELIEKVHRKALYGSDPDEKRLAEVMDPAEYFAYDAIKCFQGDAKGRVEDFDHVVDRDGLENTGFMDLDKARDFLTDHVELFNAYLSGNDEVMSCPETPMVIKLENLN